MRFAANLSMLFTELPFMARFAAANLAGFRGVEFLFPYDFEPGEIHAHADHGGVEIVLFNLPPGDWDKGERGLAALPGREAEFEAAVSRALSYADTLCCTRLHAMSGIPEQISAECEETLVRNLRSACAEAGQHGVTLLIEPINTRDMPGYFLNYTEQARRIIDAVGAENLRLQLDLYHRQVMQGDLATAIRAHIDIAGHIQVANPPDRSHPDDGEIDYGYIFEVIEDTGYAGWIGCEYLPKGPTRDSLGWFQRHRENAKDTPAR